LETEDEPPSQILYIAILPFLASSFDPTVLLGILLLILLLMGSALISGSEVAFFSLDQNDIKTFEEEDSASAKTILRLRRAPRRLLATILIANNFINIAIVIVSDYIVWNFVSEEMFLSWSEQLLNTTAWPLSSFFLARFLNFLITVVSVTFLLVLFGEVAPKVYANLNRASLSRFMSKPLSILNSLLSPLSGLLVSMSTSMEKRLGGNQLSRSGTSREDIDRAIELTVKDDLHSAEEIDILKSIVKFGDVTAKQIMRSRVDVTAVDVHTPYSELLYTVRESGYSRLPVYEEDFDQIMGILYVKDLLGHLEEGEGYQWTDLIRPEILYVPENKKINELLKEFQMKRMHMGIVVDEYGGSAGIVTLEDVMEEVIGDIKDEFDQEDEVDFVKLDSNNYIFEGKTLLNDVCRVVGISTDTFDEWKGDADSIAGLFLEWTGKMPVRDQEMRIKTYVFKVMSVSKRRIEKVKLSLQE